MLRKMYIIWKWRESFLPSLYFALQVRSENITAEREMLRQAEHRLGREKEVMLVEQRNQNLLLSNLKTIQVWHYPNDII